MMNGGPISWKSQRQDDVSLSTSEAEFVAAGQAGQDAIYLRETLNDFGYSQTKATIFYEDNPACTTMNKNPVRRKFSSHIDIKRYFVRELVLAGFLKLVQTKNGGWSPHQQLAVTGIRREPTDYDLSCSFCRSPPMLLRGLILRADFERCVFIIFFAWFSEFFFASGAVKLDFIVLLHFLIYYSFSLMFSQFFIFIVGLPNSLSLTSRHGA